MEIPNIVKNALKVPKWKKSIFKEMKALKTNGTWELVDLPRGKSTKDPLQMLIGQIIRARSKMLQEVSMGSWRSLFGQPRL